MCNNNNGFFGGNCCWIIIAILVLCFCGNGLGGICGGPGPVAPGGPGCC